jgi:hypothetical protein
MAPLIPESLIPFARSGDSEIVQVCRDAPSIEAAAESLGWSVPRLRGRLQAIESDASRRGWHPGTALPEPIPAGFNVDRLSMHYSQPDEETGEVRRSGWVIANRSKDAKIATLLAAVAEACDPIRGHYEPGPAPEPPAVDDLLCVYPIGDLHLGMYAWAQECGESFDLEIAERMIMHSMAAVIARAPAGSRALVCNLGDWFHSDTPDNRTRRSGHALDVDSRWGKVYAAGVRIQHRLGSIALRHHSVVDWLNLIGNHDDLSAQTLSHTLAAYFDREPRMSVDLSPAQHRFREFGSVLLGFHHGHETKTAALQGVMSVDQAAAWGRTNARHWYCGHVHHERVREASGCTIEYFRTLTPKDAWAAGQGYRSDRDIRCDVWHKSKGIYARFFERGLPSPTGVQA